MAPLAGLLVLALSGVPSWAAEPPATAKGESSPWHQWSDAQRSEANALATDYMRFLERAKIPLQRTEYLQSRLQSKGFQPFVADSSWKAGQRYFVTNRQRAMLMAVVGRRPLREGVRLIGAHLDSPRLDLRFKPFKAAEGLLLLSTAPYGGIKRYQWANLPLALVGQVARADGRLIDVSIGEKPGDPVFLLPDLAPHVDKEFRTRTADAVFKGDELSMLAASLPGGGGNVKKAFLDELHRLYGLVEEDFVSAELSFVPATAPRDVGLDRALIGAYGQDDGLCSYVAARGLMDLDGIPEFTSLVYLVDHEEVGNGNTTGVRSRFLEAHLERFLAREANGQPPSGALSTLLERSLALSADVSQAVNPIFPSTEDPLNTARLGQGMSLKSMRPGFDGSPALRGRLRRLLTGHKVPWQTYSYKVDGGGGATIGADLQEMNMDVVDVGVPLLAMHGTFEVSAKSDVYALKRFFGAFLSGE